MKTKTKITAKDIEEKMELPSGLTAEVTIERDDDMGPPWKEHDGHGIVSDWQTRDKEPGERILCTDRQSKRFYDIPLTMKRAVAEGWGLADEEKAELAKKLHRPVAELTAGQILAEAVERDFKHLQDWCEDRWSWMYYRVEVKDADGNEIASDSCGGFDGDTEYFRSEIADHINFAVEKHTKDQREARKAAKAEKLERAYWEQRDTVTTI